MMLRNNLGMDLSPTTTDRPRPQLRAYQDSGKRIVVLRTVHTFARTAASARILSVKDRGT